MCMHACMYVCVHASVYVCMRSVYTVYVRQYARCMYGCTVSALCWMYEEDDIAEVRTATGVGRCLAA